MRTPGSACAKTRCSARTACRASTASSSSRTAPSASCRSMTTGRSGWSASIAIRCMPIPGRSPKADAPSPNRRKRRRSRELREETGLVGRAARAGCDLASLELGQRRARLSLPGDRAHPGADEPEGTERIAVRRFEWEEAWRMLEGGRDHRLAERDRPFARGRAAARRVEADVRMSGVRLRAGSYFVALVTWLDSAERDSIVQSLGRVADDLPGRRGRAARSLRIFGHAEHRFAREIPAGADRLGRGEVGVGPHVAWGDVVSLAEVSDQGLGRGDLPWRRRLLGRDRRPGRCRFRIRRRRGCGRCGSARPASGCSSAGRLRSGRRRCRCRCRSRSDSRSRRCPGSCGARASIWS